MREPAISESERFVVRLGARTDMALLKKRLEEAGFVVEEGTEPAELVIVDSDSGADAEARP